MIIMKFLILHILFIAQQCSSPWTDEILIINSGVCLGNCPEYTLKIQSNGHYILTHPRTKVQNHGKLKKNELVALEKIILSIDFSKVKENYGNSLIRDLPKISISFGDKNLNFRGRHSAPDSLYQLILWADRFNSRN
jgi:hypothetical protein